MSNLWMSAIFKLRAPGMSVNRMPLFAWNVLSMAFAVIFALPALTGACTLLFLDRNFGMHFFDPGAGGNPVLWQHLFWIFGHPDVYILFLPPVGMISMILPVFARRPIIGYTFLAMAAVAVAFISFGVWVHHMFSTGLSLLEMSYFSGASLMIPIPSAIQMFAWISTIWKGKVNITTPFLFVVGFLIIFTMGGGDRGDAGRGAFRLAGKPHLLVFLWNIFKSLRSGPPAGDNPWNADSLEWAISSPPLVYNFQTIPVVKSRHPLWEQKSVFDEPQPKPSG